PRDDAQLGLAQTHFRPEQGKDGEDRLPVRVVEHADQPEHGDDQPFVQLVRHAARGVAAAEVGLCFAAITRTLKLPDQTPWARLPACQKTAGWKPAPRACPQAFGRETQANDGGPGPTILSPVAGQPTRKKREKIGNRY